jgi:hypothetical protein
MRPIPIFASASEIALDAHTYFYRHPDVKNYLESFEVRLLAPRFAELAREFVASYVTADITSEVLAGFGSVRSIVERLLLWCWEVKNSPLNLIDALGFRSFLEFTSSPPTEWISSFPHRRFIRHHDGEYIINPGWRPFCRKQGESEMLKKNMLIVVCSACSRFFDFLISKQVLSHNPARHVEPLFLAGISNQSVTVDRGIRTLHLDHLILAATELCKGNGNYERALFILAMTKYLLTPIRLLANSKGWVPSLSFFVEKNSWFYEPNYRGVIFRSKIPPDFLPFLERYLVSRGLRMKPGDFEGLPLFLTQYGRPGLSQRQIRNVVKEVTLKAASMMRDSGCSPQLYSPIEAATLDALRDASIRLCLVEHGIFETQRRLGNEQITSVMQRSFALAESLSQDRDYFDDY